MGLTQLIRQRCYGEGVGWTDGTLVQIDYVGPPCSAIAAMCRTQVPGGIEICLYVQGRGGQVHQAVYSPQNPASGWTHGVISLPVMPFGMNMACTYLANQAHRRIYTFDSQNHLMEYSSADGKTWTGNGALFMS